MQTNTLKEQLTEPSRMLFVDTHADTDTARDVGQAVGGQVFRSDDPQVLVNGIYNMEEYFHVLRKTALAGLKNLLANRYTAISAVVTDSSGAGVLLQDDSRQPLPMHSAPNLGEFLTMLGPPGGEQDPRICLTLLQQTVRLLEVLGMQRLALRKETTADIVHTH